MHVTKLQIKKKPFYFQKASFSKIDQKKKGKKSAKNKEAKIEKN